jgi:hypothetical protein
MKKLPYFAPSPQFADRVMARVRIQGAGQVPMVAEAMPAARRRSEAVAGYGTRGERRDQVQAPREDLRRSIPARIAATALAASLSVTIAAVALFSFFNVEVMLLVSRVFGAETVSFLTALAGDASASVTTTATGVAASAGTATGMAVAGSFAAGLVVATAALRAAASASRKAA